MRLVAFRITGYRRFEQSSTLDLTPRVVAIVGPNEAGKSSLLDALAKLTNPTVNLPFDTAEFTGRAKPVGGTVLTSGLFELEAADREAIAHVPGAEKIRLWHLGRSADGKAFADVIPEIARDQRRRRNVEGLVKRLLESRSTPLREFLDSMAPAPEGATEGEQSDEGAAQTVRELFESTLKDLSEPTDTLSADSRRDLGEATELLDGLDSPRLPKFVRKLLDEAPQLQEEHAGTHPQSVAFGILDARCPQVRVIRDDDRQLQTSYPFADTDKPPPPLANLLAVAGLDWDEVKTAADESGNPALATMLQRANRRLAEHLQASWKQSRVSIELKEQGQALHVYPYDLDSETYSRVEDRSDGFRSFLALLTFTSRYAEGGRRLILAIDEAEQHLHYDAQADLVRVLTQQSLVPQIIYTTHSAGCLPEDLGSAIRVVEPTPGDRSIIGNRFWSMNSSEGARSGFTPLLMAMGAGAVAFTPTRRAVIAEGPSDALLLPALFRIALGRDPNDPLGLQVAGGLAWTPPRRLGILEGEAAHVVYLTDSDEKGMQYHADLKDTGVDANRIFSLRSGRVTGLTVEDLVDKATYVDVVNLLLREVRGYAGAPLRVSDLPDRGAAKAMETWTRGRHVEPPSKTEIAEHLLRVSRTNLAYSHWDPGDEGAKPLLRASRRSLIAQLVARICDSLGVNPATGEAIPD